MRANRIDANQAEIVKLFKVAGCSVLNISSLKNCCDVVVAKHGRSIMVEIKDGSKCPSQRRLTDGEIIFRDSWQGAWRLVETVEDAQHVINELNSTLDIRERKFD